MPYFVRPQFACRALKKIQKYNFLSSGQWEHLEWRGATRLSTEAPKVPFLAKMTKMPLVSPRFDRRSNEVQTFTKQHFHNFAPNPSFSKIFNNFDQV